MSLETFAWLILIFPLTGAVVIGLGYRRWPDAIAGWIGTLAIAAAFAATVGALIKLLDLPEDQREVVAVGWDYANTLGLDAQISLLIDPLSIFMALVVTGVSTLIHIYSVGYMKSDKGYARFFSYLNFFVFSMLLLVMAGNFMLLIIGWAFVGAASYLLISYWYRRTTATKAGIKAFVINVIGDVCLVLGTYFLFKNTGTVDFVKTFDAVDHGTFSTNDPELVTACMLLLGGAFAKSAQVPLHTWLPDAMEGPTPVSALIHAATMVTAGVYLIARMHTLFEHAPTAAAAGAIVGCKTLIFAATIALSSTDLKRVIAYSTMSQIGYMIMAVCAGAYAAGMFHLMTHAFFKALLFMAAGSLIAAMAGVQDLDRMSGFRKVMPFTFGAMMIGGLALAGVPPFAGFFSKDEILTTVADRGDWMIALVVIGYIGALLTAIYTFRMIFRVFWGNKCPEAQELERGHLHHAEHPTNPATGEIEDTDVGFPGADHHIAEKTPSMRIAMGVLAIGVILGGFLQISKTTNVIHSFLEPTFEDSQYYNTLEPDTGMVFGGWVLGALLALLGIFIAFRIWVKDPGIATRLIARAHPIHTFFIHAWYWNEFYDICVVRPIAWCGRFCRSTIERVFINGVFVDGTSFVVRTGSAAVRAIQTGFLRYYVALLLAGVTIIGAYFLVRS